MAELVQIQRIKKSEFNARVVDLTDQRRSSYREPQLPLDRLSKFRVDRVSVDKEAPIPECTTCGVCCFLPLIVPVTMAESERLTAYCDILLDNSDEEIVVDRMLPRTEDGRCVNLGGTLRESIACRIYEERPHVCRDFDAGSDRCHEYRRMFDIEKQLTPDEVESASKLLQPTLRPDCIEDVSIVSTGTIERSSYNVADGTVEYSSATQLSIVGFLNDDDGPIELHSFESGAEIWFESDFVGLTIADANLLINEKARL